MEDFQKGLPSSDSHFYELSMDKWLIAEQRVQEILWAVQPSVASEWKRRDLIDYIQRVVKGSFGTEVLSFGSVPLKTYIPDGDIDLTILCPRNREEDLARAVCSLLQDQPKELGFLFREVRYIPAKVDQFIGRDHLFKKSIILIKAWCYYESRTLGAPAGLISTYALETLVLCIINLFHLSLHGPLQVLHKFLEYYSQFDWQNYCISINGPVSLSSVLKLRETTESEGKNLLLTKEFVKNCRVAFSERRKKSEARLQEFPIKYRNVVDPLKDNNNLGRSVNSGNCKRIQSAFAYGENQLRTILALPGESIGHELQREFFNATVDRNGRGERPDLQTPVPAFGSGRSVPSNLNGDYDHHYGGILYAQVLHEQSLHLSSQPCPRPSQVENNTTWNARPWSMEQHSWNVFNRMPVNAYGYSFYHCASQPTADMRTFAGTGTYIPDARPHYRGEHLMVRERPESRTHLVTIEPAQKDKRVVTGINTGVHVSSFGPSVEEFPHLPGMQVPPPSASLQSQVPAHTSEDHNLGVLGPAPVPLGMHSLETRADSHSSLTHDFRPRVPETGMPNQQVRSNIDEIDREQFQLHSKDFPPLPKKTNIIDEINEEQFQLDNKDFPPLGTKTNL
ncbi:uncharacterized protein LOC126802025 isoform X2 [Argentina anserina]|uniref:uncharacterized protein LOC126802025 isoform X2 n=1 Tax=Argentina anserina TaxID=57926 RepID=UPI0021765372|nr:uncharacterized protein LOC126802025 isoform X2 [Potentilla anserina]